MGKKRFIVDEDGATHQTLSKWFEFGKEIPSLPVLCPKGCCYIQKIAYKVQRGDELWYHDKKSGDTILFIINPWLDDEEAMVRACQYAKVPYNVIVDNWRK